MRPETRAQFRLRMLLRVKRAGWHRDKNDLTHALFETHLLVSDKDLKAAWKTGYHLRKNKKPCP